MYSVLKVSRRDESRRELSLQHRLSTHMLPFSGSIRVYCFTPFLTTIVLSAKHYTLKEDNFATLIAKNVGLQRFDIDPISGIPNYQTKLLIFCWLFLQSELSLAERALLLTFFFFYSSSTCTDYTWSWETGSMWSEPFLQHPSSVYPYIYQNIQNRPYDDTMILK